MFLPHWQVLSAVTSAGAASSTAENGGPSPPKFRLANGFSPFSILSGAPNVRPCPVTSPHASQSQPPFSLWYNESCRSRGLKVSRRNCWEDGQDHKLTVPGARQRLLREDLSAQSARIGEHKHSAFERVLLHILVARHLECVHR